MIDMVFRSGRDKREGTDAGRGSEMTERKWMAEGAAMAETVKRTETAETLAMAEMLRTAKAPETAKTSGMAEILDSPETVHKMMTGAFMMNEYGAVTPVAYQRILMTVAELDLYERKLDVPHMMKRMGVSWVLLALSVRVQSPPCPGEMLSVGTWMSGREGMIFRRETKICHEDGSLSAAAASFSGILDIESRRMCRDAVALDVVSRQVAFREERLLSADSRCYPDREQFQEVGDMRVLPSWIDELGHVNNSHYGEIAYDILPQTEHGRFCDLDRMEIYFLGELRKDETVALSLRQEPRQVEILGQRKRDGKDAFLARFLFGK